VTGRQCRGMHVLRRIAMACTSHTRTWTRHSPDRYRHRSRGETDVPAVPRATSCIWIGDHGDSCRLRSSSFRFISRHSRRDIYCDVKLKSAIVLLHIHHISLNMGVSLSTAKVITTSTFLYDFVVQQWAIALSKPDMKVVNDRNPGCFSPM
jgi:hypothetical protein